MPRNYNNNFDLNNNRNKVNVNPWGVLIIMILLTVLNILVTVKTGTLDFFAIVAFIACFAGIFMSVRNIIRSKKQ